MLIAPVEVVSLPRERLRDTIWERPYAFLRLLCDQARFFFGPVEPYPSRLRRLAIRDGGDLRHPGRPPADCGGDLNACRGRHAQAGPPDGGRGSLPVAETGRRPYRQGRPAPGGRKGQSPAWRSKPSFREPCPPSSFPKAKPSRLEPLWLWSGRHDAPGLPAVAKPFVL